jgi:hypothetical protein
MSDEFLYRRALPSSDLSFDAKSHIQLAEIPRRIIIARKMVLTSAFVAVEAESCFGSVTVTASPDNQDVVLIDSDDQAGSDVPLQPGEFHRFDDIDLSTLKIKLGTAGSENDYVTVMGQKR